MRFSFLIIAFVLSGFITKAQGNTEEANISDILESVAENLPDDYDMNELTVVLTRLKNHPINLNQTNPEELKALVFLSPLQISNFFAYITENGKLTDVLELQSINSFDIKTIQNLLPFVTLNSFGEYEQFRFRDFFKLGESDLVMRFAQTLQKQRGFEDLPGNRYLGSPERIQTRYRYHFGSIISASLTLDKDAGEKFKAKPFDFLSGNISAFKLGSLKKLVVGDYALQFGQGLTLWSGFSFGKGPDVTSIAKKDLGLRPYSSANEYSFFRGISATITLAQHVEITPFLSYRKLDASQSTDADGNDVQATINQTGLHRTATEIENDNALGQRIYGAVLQYAKNDLTFGAIGYRTTFSNSFITQAATYDQFSFTGNELTNLGVYYNYTFKNVYLFGEAGKSLNSGFAYTNGVLLSISPTVSASLSYRNYSKDYHSFFNQGIAEASEALNEIGLYTGLNIAPNKHWSFSLYTDYFRFPWLKYRIDAPSNGYEIFVQAVYSPAKTLKLLWRFKTETKQQNTDLEVPVNFLDNVKKEGYRFEVSWQISKNWAFQNRFEVSQYKKGDVSRELGYLIYQDINYLALSKLSGNIRLAYFNTPSYNSRIYAYEDDVLYNFAFGMYSGKGYRSYLNLRYRLAKKLDVWTRYAIFIYGNTETVGTYLDEIQGNKKSEIKIQLRYRF
ncbi:helix-hairpin-helix domain-containing protein [Pedobacter sp. BMA]|uniref:helix-hairpin-helix domain-containing protein n=1 Tax=Pedobacter sp. BMA TaxID=1663685 RepID=UPI000649840F|nr:helix-hairpin-helix domain-containing protein [Pedobacter sp. BMA]KLT67133.1 hypothetical protein AB669_03095 [Pedobacter sp. BMA]